MSTPNPVTASATTTMAPPTRLEHLALEAIHADPGQVRKEFHVDQLQELADSIRAKGVVQPLIVRPGAGGAFTLIAGERRLRAAKAAGLLRVPCIVREGLAASEVPVLQMVENLQRSDLSLSEVAAGVAALCKTRSQDEAAKLLGKSKSWVSKRAAVLDLPPQIKKLVDAGKIQDPEIANGIGELLKLDADAATGMLEDIETPKTWSHPPTRESVREAVTDAKESAERAAAREAVEAQRKAAAVKAGKSEQPELSAQQKKYEADRIREEERRKRRRAKIRAIEKSCNTLIRAALPKFGDVVGKKVKLEKDGSIASYYHQAVYFRPDLAQLEWGSSAVPEHTDDVGFEVNLKLTGKELLKLLAKLGIEAKGLAAQAEADKPAPPAKVAAAKGVKAKAATAKKRK